MMRRKKNNSPHPNPLSLWGRGKSEGVNEEYLILIEAALERTLPLPSSHPPEIHEAMRYALLNGGKRFRPLLVLRACEAVGGEARQALLAASAVEMTHAYSLVHDDLPALDNDEMRRGKPACHKKFGEALAILTGDALLTRAFQLLGEIRPAQKALALLRELAEAAGTQGMIGGQTADILISQNGSSRSLDLSTLDFISRRKTGRLIEASAMMGAMMGTPSSSKRARMRRFGGSLGLAFQVVDDIMDGDGYLQLMTPDEARRKAQSLIQRAREEGKAFGRKAKGLLELTNFLWESIPAKNHAAVGFRN